MDTFFNTIYGWMDGHSQTSNHEEKSVNSRFLVDHTLICALRNIISGRI